MASAAKHLPENFETTPKGEKISLRDSIFSEIFANSLAFRDYGKEFRARFRIESARVFLENGRTPGKKPGEAHVPNPLISAVFKHIGWGAAPSKHSPIALWGKAYFGTTPVAVEGSFFRILAPFPQSIASRPAQDNAWDISEMLTTQAPWTHSKAAQAEVGATRGALDTLIEGPILAEVENMQLPSPMEPLDIYGRPWRGPLPETSSPSPQPPASPRTSPGHAPAPQTPASRPAPAPSVSRPAIPLPSLDSETPALARPVNGHLVNGRSEERAPTPGSKTQAVLQAERVEKILEFCKTPRYRSEVQAHVGIVNRDYFRKDILNPLIENGLLAPTLPDKPNSPKQQYATVGK
jgi:ATP-dependent DNA helicase RecG